MEETKICEMEKTASLLLLSVSINGAFFFVFLFLAGSKLYRTHKPSGERTRQAEAALSPLSSSLDSDASSSKRGDEVPRDEPIPVGGSLHADKSLSDHEWKYHVFLSFRGEDTRFKFTDHLYQAFCRAGINVFRDQEELQIGDEISPALLGAIEASMISIIVISRDYASSTWCLDELVKILELRGAKKQVVFPIFYEVDPSEVRPQKGSFRVSMANHEKRYRDNTEKVKKWRSALREVANMSGESYEKESESEFIKKIIERISSIVYHHPLLQLPEQAIGLESRKSQVVSLLSIKQNDKDVSMIGIYGTGGVGKTTIAKAVYNSVAAQFESTRFCVDVQQNITKHGFAHIHQSIVIDMLGINNTGFHISHIQIAKMKKRLKTERVLLVLDDVDTSEQLRALAGGCDWFGPGSRVIITTRDKQLLHSHGIEKMYEVTELDKEEALKLLCWNAFRSCEPKIRFEDVSTRVLSYARGIPLALEIIGSHLFGKEVDKWESAMDAYQSSMNNEIFGILKVSYESLRYNEKEIFLDVACFLRGASVDYVEEILGGCGFKLKSGLSTLEDKCLVKIQDGRVQMHDLIQSMGRELVRRESEREPWKRSKIWFHEDALPVLTRDMGTSKIPGLMLEFPQQKEVEWNGEALKKMVNLRILIIRKAIFREAPKELPNSLRVFEWENYPSSSLPSNFHGNELLELQLKNAPQIVQLHEPFKKFQNITSLAIEDCNGLNEVPDVSAVPNLSRLRVAGCLNLVKIHDSVGSLDNLKELLLLGCPELKEFPAWNQFKSLLDLGILGCGKLGITPFDGRQTTLKCISFHDDGIDFQSDNGSGLIQVVMDHHYRGEYCISGSQIPRCFNYRSNKKFVSFWIQETLPDVHVSFALNGSARVNQDLSLRLSIGTLTIFHKIYFLVDPTTHIYLLPRFLPNKANLKIQEMLIGFDDWVPVDIRVVTSPDISPSASSDRNRDLDAFVTDCGVYVSPTCDANFTFIDPYNRYLLNDHYDHILIDRDHVPYMPLSA